MDTKNIGGLQRSKHNAGNQFPNHIVPTEMKTWSQKPFEACNFPKTTMKISYAIKYHLPK